MGYFPGDIPFMSEEERKYYGIRTQKDESKDIQSKDYDCDCGWYKPGVFTDRKNNSDRMTWIKISNTLFKCPYCMAVQLKSDKCKYCKKKVTK